MSQRNEQIQALTGISAVDGGCRPTGMAEIPVVHIAAPPAVPDPESHSPETRRRHTASYKLQLLEELDRSQTADERGAIIRREGLYASQISEWRKARQSGALSALNCKRGRKPIHSPQQERLHALQQEVAALQAQLAEAEVIIDIQKKVSNLFGSRIQTKLPVGRTS